VSSLERQRTRRLASRGRKVAFDQRSEYESDRDRIIYSSSFRRLNSVTQVVLASEGQLTHNRLLHSIKVAQVAEAIAAGVAEIAVKQGAVDAIEYFGGLDRHCASSGALAHDLGHPPFGHVGEYALRDCVDEALADVVDTTSDGFEGNAQSFRIVTRLSLHREHSRAGLNLTMAGLNAMQKYPWVRSAGAKKYGCYDSDVPALAEAREYVEHLGRRRTLEAEIVDIADDITYAVHDVEDFFRAGLIPLVEFRHYMRDATPMNSLRARAMAAWQADKGLREWMCGRADVPTPLDSSPDHGLFAASLEHITATFPNIYSYEGSSTERGALRHWTSTRIAELLDSIKLSDDVGVALGDEGFATVLLLKEFTRSYIIDNPRLTNPQAGQRRILRTLFAFYLTELHENRPVSFPAPFREEARIACDTGDTATQVRLVADTVSAFTEERAMEVFGQITGQDLGSVFATRPV
jgi:dGTPase